MNGGHLHRRRWRWPSGVFAAGLLAAGIALPGIPARQAAASDVTPAVDAQPASNAKRLTKRERIARVLRFARLQIGKPYRYGAAGPNAYDCSGLTMSSWRQGRVFLPRTSQAQYASVRRKVPWSRLQAGDLVFFLGRGHVGIYVGDGRMIHSPHSGARVSIVRLNSWWRSNFVGAVRPLA